MGFTLIIHQPFSAGAADCDQFCSVIKTLYMCRNRRSHCCFRTYRTWTETDFLPEKRRHFHGRESFGDTFSFSKSTDRKATVPGFVFVFYRELLPFDIKLKLYMCCSLQAFLVKWSFTPQQSNRFKTVRGKVMAHAAAHLKKARELEQSSEYKALQKARERRRRQRERAERKRLVRSRSCNVTISVGFSVRILCVGDQSCLAF